MAITRVPSIRYIESDTDPVNNGDGARIPIMIGFSKNTITTQKIKKYTSWDEINKPFENGGIGVYTGDKEKDGELLTFFHDFYEEANIQDSEEVGVPYVYVIDLGDTYSIQDIDKAITLSKTIKGVDMEVYVGFKKNNLVFGMQPVMTNAYDQIITESERGDIRTAYFAPTDCETDADLISMNVSQVQKSRLFLAEYALFGKTIARICVTPYDTEVGYLEYRSVTPGTFKNRTYAEELALQNGGIIFNHDEKTVKNIYSRINLGVSLAFGKASTERPNDALLHARFNSDHCIKRCIAEIFPQLKANETATNLTRCQTLVDRVVEDEINKGAMMEGSKISIKESDDNAYVFEVRSQLIPVNHTNNIDMVCYVGLPQTVVMK